MNSRIDAAMVCVCVMALACCACSSSKASKAPDKTSLTNNEPLPEKSAIERLEPHPFWPVFTPRALPATFAMSEEERLREDIGVHVADVPRGAKLELWAGGQTVESCPIKDRRIIAATPETLTFLVEGHRFYFFPTISRDAVPSNRLRADALLYDDRYVPFAYLEQGGTVTAEPGDREGLTKVCLNPPKCDMRGWIQTGYIGQSSYVQKGSEKSAHDFLPEEAEYVEHHTDARVDLYDSRGRVILSNLAPMGYFLLAGDGERAEIVLFSYDLETSDLPTAQTAFHGYIDAELVPPPPDGGLGIGGRGMGGYGRGGGSGTTSRKIYLLQRDWVYGAPEPEARLAQVRNNWVMLLVTPDADHPEGWLEVTIGTPWEKKTRAFVREEDVLDAAPSASSSATVGYRMYPGTCKP